MGKGKIGRPTQLGRYELIHRLGAGGMAEVFLARKRGPMNFEKLVVIKKIHPHLAQQEEFIKMFLREARISALLKHPRIVDMYDLGEVDKTYFIAMEYLAGQTLARVIPVGIRNRTPLDPLDAARIIADAADGLHAAHTLVDMEGNAKPVIHRDVSPGNIMVLYNGGVKLLDFGIAKARGEITTVGGPVLKGKAGYVSPEQILGDDIDPRSDIFSLGIVFWEALSGRRLFREADDMATLDAIRTSEIARPSSLRSEVPQPLDDICLRALDKDRDKRFQSARELRIEIENFLWTASYNREADTIAIFMNDVFADDILAQQEIVRRGLTRAAQDGDEEDEQVIFVDLDDDGGDDEPVAEQGSLPLPAPNKTGQIPILAKASKTPPPPIQQPLAKAAGKGGIAAGVTGAVGSVATAISGTATGAAALSMTPKPLGKAKSLGAPKPLRASRAVPVKSATPDKPTLPAEETNLPAVAKAAKQPAKRAEFDDDDTNVQTQVDPISQAKPRTKHVELALAAIEPGSSETKRAARKDNTPLPPVTPLPIPVKTTPPAAKAPPTPQPEARTPVPEHAPLPLVTKTPLTPEVTLAVTKSGDARRRTRMLFIAGGCAALVVVIVLILSLGGDGDDKDDKVAGQNTSTDTSKVSRSGHLKTPTNDNDNAATGDNKTVDAKKANANNSGTTITDPAPTPRSDTGSDSDAGATITDPAPTPRSDTGSDSDAGATITDPAPTPRSDTGIPKHTRTPRNTGGNAKAKRDPAKARTLFRRGARDFIARKWFAAKRRFKAAIKADPSFAKPYRGLGLLYEKQRRKATAVRYLRKYLDLAGNAPDVANIKRVIKRLGG